MSAPAATLKERADIALRNEFLRKAVRFTAERQSGQKHKSTEALGHWEEWRECGRAIRAHTIAHLDYYLDQFTRQVTAQGGHVHFAADAAEAATQALDIARTKGAKLVAKSKSMVTEEVGINHRFEPHGIRCVETDLGEWIVQLAHETPSHIINPAIHKNRQQIQELFEREGGEKLSTETAVLAGFARRRLREIFQQADIGMTGCNFAVAETGSMVLFTSEGNGRMVTTLPRIQLVMMGMERIVPSLDDLEVMANILPRSATGQKLTVYMSVLTGPRRAGEADGPEELHIIILDNGRSDQLGDPEFQSVLNCIRCGACLNVCPVYRHIGGHAYGGVYSGPIGAVLTPLLQQNQQADKAQWAETANASSLCGACFQACPVKIPLHDMLVHLRRRRVEAALTGAGERLGFKLFSRVFRSPRWYRLAGAMSRWLAPLANQPWAAPFLGPLKGWLKHRTLPKPAPRSFQDLWSDLKDERRTTPSSSPLPPKGGGRPRGESSSPG